MAEEREAGIGSADTNVEAAVQDCLEALREKLNLSTEENERIQFEEEEIDRDEATANLQLVAKLLASRPTSLDVLKSLVVKVWAVRGGIDCMPLGPNLFLFKFQKQSDAERIVQGGPWHVDNNLLILERYKPEKLISSYSFDSIPIWIQCTELPHCMMRENISTRLGEKVGKVIEIDVDERGVAKGGSIRVKVLLPINKPYEVRGCAWGRVKTNGSRSCMSVYHFFAFDVELWGIK